MVVEDGFAPGNPDSVNLTHANELGNPENG
jgi:hypothetical protein